MLTTFKRKKKSIQCLEVQRSAMKALFGGKHKGIKKEKKD